MDNKLKTWHFEINNDELVKLVLSGSKTATSCIYKKSLLPKIGDREILIFDNEKIPNILLITKKQLKVINLYNLSIKIQKKTSISKIQ